MWPARCEPGCTMRLAIEQRDGALHEGSRAGARRRFGLRGTVMLWSALFGAVAIALAIAIVVVTTLLHDVTWTMLRDTRSRALADEMEVRLEMHDSLGDLAVASDNSEVARPRATLELQMRANLDEARTLIANERERHLLDDIEHLLDEALSRRRALEARDAPLEEVVREMRAPLVALHDRLGELRRMNVEQVERAQRETERVDRLASTAGIAAAVLIASGLAALVAGLHRRVLRPLAALRDEITHPASTRGTMPLEQSPREIREISTALGEMRGELARQREERLAFLAGVAHDLRNPLSALKMAISLARTDASARERTLAMADRQIELLARMIGDLLDATRIEAGELALTREPIDLREVAREVVELHAPTATSHTIALHAPERPVTVRADVLRMQQVVGNLVSNAIKYSPEGGPIEVHVGREGERAFVSVVDHGIGIASGDREKLFTPFRRSRGARAVATGAGIGLSVARRIVEAHGGDIAVDSTVGLGSTFRVSLPTESATSAGGIPK
ncbi:Two-component sensor histidine kinase [Sandaracinus amylolyticus]|uniref:histidine kinase n=2 Tax=Sandaracinus amylolyticus TaxID=927083 RepID=A0A0F6SI08_9BACT|nr:Two-component sensor histidine kinase [Sandaracinus amylolyticus]